MTAVSAPWPGLRRARRLRATVAGALAGPTASARVERAIAVCVAALRLSVVVQMLPAVSAGVAASPRPALYAAVWVAAATVAATVSVASLLRRGPLGPRLMLVDVGLALAFFALAGLTVPPGHLLGSWVGWAPGYALSVVMTLGAMRSSRLWLGAVLAVMVGYAGYVAPVITGPAWPTIVGNLLGYLVLAGTLRLIIAFVRRISGEADAARAEVARLARREEEHRAQLAFHDATTVMQLLADPTLPAELRAQLQTQAVAEVRRMRTYLRGESTDAAGAPTELAGLVRTATDGFGDLRLLPTLDLVTGVRLEASAAAALVDALRTVLHNVRRHADAGRVVLHGDVADDGDGERWTLTVRDDGRGFDPDTTTLGVGLRTQVIGELARHGLDAEVSSAPGQGTAVEISGPVGE